MGKRTTCYFNLEETKFIRQVQEEHGVDTLAAVLDIVFGEYQKHKRECGAAAAVPADKILTTGNVEKDIEYAAEHNSKTALEKMLGIQRGSKGRIKTNAAYHNINLTYEIYKMAKKGQVDLVELHNEVMFRYQQYILANALVRAGTKITSVAKQAVEENIFSKKNPVMPNIVNELEHNYPEMFNKDSQKMHPLVTKREYTEADFDRRTWK